MQQSLTRLLKGQPEHVLINDSNGCAGFLFHDALCRLMNGVRGGFFVLCVEMLATETYAGTGQQAEIRHDAGT